MGKKSGLKDDTLEAIGISLASAHGSLSGKTLFERVQRLFPKEAALLRKPGDMQPYLDCMVETGDAHYSRRTYEITDQGEITFEKVGSTI